MDWQGVVEWNAKRLQGILAMLVAMAGLDANLTSPLRGGLREASGGGCVVDISSTRRSGDRRPPLNGEVKAASPPTLSRRLHRAILRLLRPAESAARRLIIVAARDIAVELPPLRPRKPGPDRKAAHAALRSLGIAIVMSPADFARAAAAERAAASARRARAIRPLSLPLVDPLRRPFRVRRRTVPAHAAPRILSFDGARPHRLPPPPSADDPVDATRLARRLAALASALDDLPGHARRFARWRARRDRSGTRPIATPGFSPVHGGPEGPARPAARPGNGPRSGGGGGDRARIRRLSPLRFGRPPGQRAAGRRRHEVHDILADLQYFAREALERPDTS